jgi:hypothetical protein
MPDISAMSANTRRGGSAGLAGYGISQTLKPWSPDGIARSI